MSFKNEKIIETKTCQKCQVSFDITDKDLEFYERISPVFGGEKYNIGIPSLCYMCRNQRRLTFRNERNLYSRKCDFSGEDIISIHRPGTDYTVYHHDIWWSDSWDGLDYGRDFDFSRGFFGQFGALMKSVPRISSWIQNSQNCDYTNFMKGGKNNYLSFASSESEDVLYSTWTTRSHDCVDCFYCNNIQNSYDCFQCHESHSLFYSAYCNNSSNLYYCYGCEGCSNCILSSNLINKSYYIENLEYSPQEYEQLSKKYLSQKIPRALPEHIQVPDVVNSEDSLGSEIYHSKNARHCFGVNDIEDCKYCFEQFGGQKDCMDCSGSVGTLCYESGISVNSTHNIGVIGSLDCQYTYYCDLCTGSSHLFGCIGLKNQKYCILNKQYSKAEYEKLVPKIIEKMKQDGEWGEFFPASMSPFGYNETVASEYFPLPPPNPLLIKEGETSGVSGGGGFNWSTYAAPFPKVKKTIPTNKLPSNIEDIPDDILNWAIECEVTKKPFRIISKELEFYRKHTLPIPRRHPDQRHLDRVSLRNPRKLFERDCDKCSIEINTTYAPERPEQVYCESCYNKEVY